MKKEYQKKFTGNLFENQENYMESFRKNIDLCMDITGLKIREVAELADIPYGTFNTFLYGNAEDCKLSTAVKLARVFGLSVDEMVGAGTIDPITRESLSICRNLPEHALYLIRYFIRHQNKIYEQQEPGKKTISLLKPQTVRNRLVTTNVTEPLCIDHLPESIKASVYVGILIPEGCDHYMPYYAPEEIILIAADRDAVDRERCVVTHEGRIFIVTKRSYIEQGIKKWKYVALMNEKIVIPQSEIDDKVGYIVGFLNPDESWGRR